MLRTMMLGAVLGLVGCDAPEVSEYQVEQARTERTLEPPGPDGVKIGQDVRTVDAALFENGRGPPSACNGLNTIEECERRLWPDGRTPMGTPAYLIRAFQAEIDVGGLPSRAEIFVNERFVIDTITLDLGNLNQESYGAVMHLLEEQYGVQEASESEYAAYNANAEGCLAHGNADGTVLFIERKRVGAGPIRTNRVVYRSMEANNRVINDLARNCLTRAPDGL